jgi:hypothetical protein
MAAPGCKRKTCTWRAVAGGRSSDEPAASGIGQKKRGMAR